MSENNENSKPVTAGSECSARLGVGTDPREEPLTPVERLAVHLDLSHHQGEADALLLLDPLFRFMLKKPGPYTKNGQELADMLLEALESWLPEDLKIVDA